MDVEEYSWQGAKFDELSKLIDEAQTIAVCAHTSPDGDALGSNLGLSSIIKSKWPEKEVVSLLADATPIPRIYRFLPYVEDLVYAKDYTDDPDLFICVDLPVVERMADGAKVQKRAAHTAIIDHHPGPENRDFADVVIERTDAAAAGVLVAELALYWQITLTPEIAQLLFCAIVTDTGRFQYQNADGEAFEIASLLVDAGASPSNIALNVYQSFRLEYLHLQSAVMGRITTFANGKIAYSYATLADFERTGAELDETDGLIDIVRTVQGSEVALFLKESADGSVRGNLRSKGEHDISNIAREMGGGGHKAAAGFTAEGGIDDVFNACLPKLIDLFEDGDID